MSKYSHIEITALLKALRQGAKRCKKDGDRMDECSFGYETGVLITGNDALYLADLIEKSLQISHDHR